MAKLPPCTEEALRECKQPVVPPTEQPKAEGKAEVLIAVFASVSNRRLAALPAPEM